MMYVLMYLIHSRDMVSVPGVACPWLQDESLPQRAVTVDAEAWVRSYQDVSTFLKRARNTVNSIVRGARVNCIDERRISRVGAGNSSWRPQPNTKALLVYGIVRTGARSWTQCCRNTWMQNTDAEREVPRREKQALPSTCTHTVVVEYKFNLGSMDP